MEMAGNFGRVRRTAIGTIDAPNEALEPKVRKQTGPLAPGEKELSCTKL